MVTANTAQLNNEKVTTTRPPIVVVLGHVDHGKSSLLEAIREDFKITAKESGGITQHIGAYMVEVPQEPKSRASETSRGTLRQAQVFDSEVAQTRGGDFASETRKITFIDTPGHELFSAMRSRGAKVADIAVLVVAADESVKPQTIEAIAQIKKAGIPMVVAIHKIDKPEANPQRVKQELAQHEVMVESFGGNVPAIETSATTRQGIQELLEMILLVAELENVSAKETAAGQGTIIESHLDPKRGPTATLLVENGTVQVGDFIATKSTFGKVRILEGFQGQAMRQALPSMPAAVLGFLQAPFIGEEFQVFETEKAAHEFVDTAAPKKQQAKAASVSPNASTVSVIIKADVAGSLEALETALSGISTEETVLEIVGSGVGEIGENDVKLARSAAASILGFKTKVSASALDLAEKENVSIETFEVIYELIEKGRMLLEQSLQDRGGREDIGVLRVLAIFLVDKTRQVIGGKVAEGEIRKGLKTEIARAGEVVGKGKLTNLQKDKKDVSVVEKGSECGLSFEAAERIQVGDELHFFIERAPKK